MHASILRFIKLPDNRQVYDMVSLSGEYTLGHRVSAESPEKVIRGTTDSAADRSRAGIHQ